MPLEFSNPEVKAKYEATVDVDVNIRAHGYHGLLTKITIAGAAKLVSTNSQYIKEKKPAGKPAAEK